MTTLSSIFVVVDTTFDTPIVIGANPETDRVVFVNGQGIQGNPAYESVAVFIQGTPQSNEVLARYDVTNALTLSASLSRSSSGVASTGVSVFKIYNGASQVGTLTFGASSTTGAFAISTPAFIAGNVLIVYAPLVPDATLGDVSLTLVGT